MAYPKLDPNFIPFGQTLNPETFSPANSQNNSNQNSFNQNDFLLQQALFSNVKYCEKCRKSLTPCDLCKKDSNICNECKNKNQWTLVKNYTFSAFKWFGVRYSRNAIDMLVFMATYKLFKKFGVSI